MITASGYLKNPMGKGSAIMQIGLVSRSLDHDYEILHQKMSHTWWLTTSGGPKAIAHIKVPSRKIEDLYYDVILEFDISNLGDSLIISEVPMKVFSNCPSFTFTYAYVFTKNGDTINWCKPKYAKKILKKKPEERNPYGITSYERSIYLAIKYILSNRRNVIYEIRRTGKKIRKREEILKNIHSSDEILELYDKGRSLMKKQKEKEKQKEEKKKSSEKKQEMKRSNKKGHVGSVKSVKRSKKTSKMKKI